MNVEHHNDPSWIRDHLSHSLADRPCYITAQTGETELHRARWPLVDAALPTGTPVHVRYEAQGLQCGFFTVVEVGHGGLAVLKEPASLAMVSRVVEQPMRKAA